MIKTLRLEHLLTPSLCAKSTLWMPIRRASNQATTSSAPVASLRADLESFKAKFEALQTLRDKEQGLKLLKSEFITMQHSLILGEKMKEWLKKKEEVRGHDSRYMSALKRLPSFVKRVERVYEKEDHTFEAMILLASTPSPHMRISCLQSEQQQQQQHQQLERRVRLTGFKHISLSREYEGGMDEYEISCCKFVPAVQLPNKRVSRVFRKESLSSPRYWSADSESDVLEGKPPSSDKLKLFSYLQTEKGVQFIDMYLGNLHLVKNHLLFSSTPFPTAVDSTSTSTSDGTTTPHQMNEDEYRNDDQEQSLPIVSDEDFFQFLDLTVESIPQLGGMNIMQLLEEYNLYNPTDDKFNLSRCLLECIYDCDEEQKTFLVD